MFERFNDQSRRAVVLAREEARRFDHTYIGTEHLLLGLLHEGKGSAARALASLDVTLDAARRELEAISGRGSRQPAGQIPFTPRAKKSLELSLRECLQLGSDYIGTGHLLLGLIGEGESVATQVLGKLGADLKDLRARVVQELHDHPEQRGAAEVPDDPERQRIVFRQRNEIQRLLDTLEERLDAIEQHLGITRTVPGELPRLDARIARIRRDKQAAIEAQDFEKAAALRDAERQLLIERARVAGEMQAGRAEGAKTGKAAEPGEVAEQAEAAEPGEVAEQAEAAEPGEVGEQAAAAEPGEVGEQAAAAEPGRAAETHAAVDAEQAAAAETGAGADEGKSAEPGEVFDTGEAAEGSDELTRLRARLARLEAQLREHDIDPDQPGDPPAAAG